MKTLKNRDIRKVTGGVMSSAGAPNNQITPTLVKEINPRDFAHLWEGLFNRPKHFLDHLLHY